MTTRPYRVTLARAASATVEATSPGAAIASVLRTLYPEARHGDVRGSLSGSRAAWIDVRLHFGAASDPLDVRIDAVALDSIAAPVKGRRVVTA